jgi:peroxiredoxin
MYDLEPQDKVVFHLGDTVTVRGTLDGDTVQVASIERMSIGLAVGQKTPAFSVRDQFGRVQTLETLKGRNGTVLLFFRSADWWPFCKGQLVQLQGAIPRFEKQGVKLAAISYDTEEILKYFADRHKIEYPMLADPDSKTIKAYGVLNQEATGMQRGFARPGYFFIGPDGIIKEKFFEAKYRERLSGNNVISKLFPELGEEVSSTVEAPHLQLAAEQSDRTGVPGSRITLIAEVRLPRDIHVYAPGTKGYKTVDLVMDSPPGMELTPSIYPRGKGPLYACDTGACARVRRNFSYPAGFENKLHCRVQQFARHGWQDLHYHWKACVSGLRQQDLLSTDLGAHPMASASSAPWSAASAGEH